MLGSQETSWIKVKTDGLERVLWRSVGDLDKAPFLVDGVKHSSLVEIIDLQSCE